ncbi:hypothetical protein EYF80_041309 [Liparis tanakae]|uniref:Uncharacterized protein n=1 Tax=Liparis tanakae TaxID=230148 RepID=A0A4Z2G4K4_9TELE|nr:hypothetical protein EYF80_041309 [Liparis tanakae]
MLGKQLGPPMTHRGLKGAIVKTRSALCCSLTLNIFNRVCLLISSLSKGCFSFTTALQRVSRSPNSVLDTALETAHRGLSRSQSSPLTREITALSARPWLTDRDGGRGALRRNQAATSAAAEKQEGRNQNENSKTSVCSKLMDNDELLRLQTPPEVQQPVLELLVLGPQALQHRGNPRGHANDGLHAPAQAVTEGGDFPGEESNLILLGGQACGQALRHL